MLRQTNLNLTNRFVGGVLLVVAVAGAVTLVWLGQAGGFDMAVFVSVSIVATVAALFSLEFGLMALIFVAATDGFLKGLSPGWHTQLLKDYLLAICLLRWAWLSVLGHRRESVRQPVSLPIIIFGGWVLVQLVNAQSGSIVVGLAGLRMWTIWLPTFFLAYDTIVTRRQVERMVLFVIGLMVPLTFYGIIQYYIGLDHLFQLGEGFDVYEYSYYAGSAQDEWRPPSTMVSPHALADTLTMVALMAVGAAVYFHRNRLLQLALFASIPLMGIGILITAVRNAAASAVLGVAALFIIVRRIDLAILASVIGLLAIMQVDAITGGEAVDRISSIVENPGYTRQRIMGPWRLAIRYALEHPLGGGIASGQGLGRLKPATSRTFAPEQALPYTESGYGQALAQLGFPGFLAFIWMLWAVMRGILKAYRAVETRRDRWLIAGIFAACFSILARLLVGPALYGWPEAPIFWYFAAISLRLVDIEAMERLDARFAGDEISATYLGNRRLPWNETSPGAAGSEHSARE